MITNGDFQNGFTGWTQSGNTGGTLTRTLSSVNLIPPDSDPSVSTTARLGPIGTEGFLTQTITGTQSGACYQLKFFLHNGDASAFITPNSFSVSYNIGSLGITASGNPAISVPLVNSGPFGGTSFLEFTTVVTATNAPPILEFSFRQDPSYFYLTGVSYSLIGASPEFLCNLTSMGAHLFILHQTVDSSL